MVIGDGFGGAVVAVDVCSCVSVLVWHGLGLDLAVEVAELGFHVHDALAADRALVRGFAPFLETGVVDAVPASHEDDGAGGGEEILAADRTVAFGAAFYTAVAGLDVDAHADSAGLAVEEISSQPFSKSADSTVVAVVDRLGWIIVPEFAHGTVITSCLFAT